ncbi:MAG TPA: ABC transporter permease [Gaiellales bacterium]|jgi:peptide/nickel transport system permease protein|nr:ABC transporter permease [Gaiellales bacterium]
MTEAVLAQRPGTIRRAIGPQLGRLGWVGIGSAVVIVLLALMAIFAPLLAPQDPNAIDLLHPNAGATSQHLLGTDDTGRDLLSRLIIGSRTSLLGPLLAVLLEVVIGVPIALAAAWNGGVVDGVISRVLDVLFAFPGILLAILVIALFGAGLRSAIVALAVAHLPYLARITRGAAIRERRLPYVEALELQGFSGPRICARHLTPNLLPLIVAQACVSFGYVMIDLAALSFLGLGVQPPTADWGVMISTGEQSLLAGHPQQSMYAGFMIVLAVCAFTLFGERLIDYDRADAG